MKALTPEDVLQAIKQAANTLYALGWDQVKVGAEERQGYRQLSERLDAVTRALGGNPMTPAWSVPGNPRRERRPHRNTNLSGCQSRLYWAHGVAAKCKLDPGHDGAHHNGTRTWGDDEATDNAVRFGRVS